MRQFSLSRPQSILLMRQIDIVIENSGRERDFFDSNFHEINFINYVRR